MAKAKSRLNHYCFIGVDNEYTTTHNIKLDKLGTINYNDGNTECSLVVRRTLWEREIVGSNPTILTWG